MKYLIILTVLISSCTPVTRITSSNFVEPPVMSQPVIVEPISATVDENTPVDLSQTNDVFMNLALLVVLICVLSVMPKLIRYLKVKLGRYPNGQDNG